MKPVHGLKTMGNEQPVTARSSTELRTSVEVAVVTSYFTSSQRRVVSRPTNQSTCRITFRQLCDYSYSTSTSGNRPVPIGKQNRGHAVVITQTHLTWSSSNNGKYNWKQLSDLRCDVAWVWRDKTDIFHDGSYDLSAELCTVSRISCYASQ